MSAPSLSFGRALVAVLWAFIGIRRKDQSLADLGVRPVHIIVAGVSAAAIFVVSLISFVRFVVIR